MFLVAVGIAVVRDSWQRDVQFLHDPDINLPFLLASKRTGSRFRDSQHRRGMSNQHDGTRQCGLNLAV